MYRNKYPRHSIQHSLPPQSPGVSVSASLEHPVFVLYSLWWNKALELEILDIFQQLSVYTEKINNIREILL